MMTRFFKSRQLRTSSEPKQILIEIQTRIDNELKASAQSGNSRSVVMEAVRNRYSMPTILLLLKRLVPPFVGQENNDLAEPDEPVRLAVKAFFWQKQQGDCSMVNSIVEALKFLVYETCRSSPLLDETEITKRRNQLLEDEKQLLKEQKVNWMNLGVKHLQLGKELESEQYDTAAQCYLEQVNKWHRLYKEHCKRRESLYQEKAAISKLQKNLKTKQQQEQKQLWEEFKRTIDVSWGFMVTKAAQKGSNDSSDQEDKNQIMERNLAGLKNSIEKIWGGQEAYHFFYKEEHDGYAAQVYKLLPLALIKLIVGYLIEENIDNSHLSFMLRPK